MDILGYPRRWPASAVDIPRYSWGLADWAPPKSVSEQSAAVSGAVDTNKAPPSARYTIIGQLGIAGSTNRSRKLV
jgi:hypothetical protein